MKLKRSTRSKFDAAHSSKKRHFPLDLQNLWRRERPTTSIEEYLATLRHLINHADLDDVTKQNEHLLTFVEIMVERFEYLVEKGEFDDNLSKLRALPLLYSPKAGKGASHWERAYQLFHNKNVSANSWKKYRVQDSTSVRNPIWADLGDFTLRVINVASQELPRFLSLQQTAVFYCDLEKRRERARKACRIVLYILANDEVLFWPDWLNSCANLPARVSDSPEGYRAAASAVLNNFFADPENQYAEEILNPLLARLSYPEAVNEARKAVLKYIANQ